MQITSYPEKPSPESPEQDIFLSWGSSQRRIGWGLRWTRGGLWLKVTEERERTGFSGLKGSYRVWCSGYVSNHPAPAFLPPQAKAIKYAEYLLCRNPSKLSCLKREVSLPLIITQTIFSWAQQSCPFQPACLFLSLPSQSALQWFYFFTAQLPPSFRPAGMLLQ